MLMLRSTHEALMAAKNAEIMHWMKMWGEEREACARAIARADALFDKLTERVTAPAPVPAPRVAREPDAVDTAIEWVAQGDIPKRRFLERFVRGERRKGRPVDEIAAEILHGSKVDPEDDGIPE